MAVNSLDTNWLADTELAFNSPEANWLADTELPFNSPEVTQKTRTHHIFYQLEIRELFTSFRPGRAIISSPLLREICTHGLSELVSTHVLSLVLDRVSAGQAERAYVEQYPESTPTAVFRLSS